MLFNANSFSGMLFGLLISGAFGFWGYKLAAKRGQNPWLWAIIAFIFPIALLAFFFINKSKTGEESGSGPFRNQNISQWPDKDNIDYRHYFKNTGIAVDKENKKIYLKSSFNGSLQEKQYNFSDIRGWNTNVQSGGHVVQFGNVGANAALGAAAHNFMVNRRNEEQTGLFIEVRDIDFPEWRIGFPPSKGRDLELKRWMEIMRQVVNEE